MRHLVLALSLTAIAFGQSPIKAPDPNPGLPPATPEQIAELTAKLDEIKSLIQDGKLSKAYRANMDFSSALGKITVPHLTLEQKLHREEDAIAQYPATREARLAMASHAALDAGQLDKAEKYACELLELAQSSSRLHSHAMVNEHIHAAHLLLCRVALQRAHDVATAKVELLAAAKVDPSASASMQRYGPNMSLARDLLSTGEQATVVEYINSFRGLSAEATEKLAHWVKLIQSEAIPDFGANILFYM